MLELSLKDILINKDFITAIQGNIDNNDIILEYYDRLISDTERLVETKNLANNNQLLEYYDWLLSADHADAEKNTLKNKRNRIADCNQVWAFDLYEQSRVQDFKRTNLCKDKFCNNCKKVKQASRMARFTPEIQKHENLYQLVLTVPNVLGEELRATIKKMFKSFAKLTEYLKGKKKIKGLDFIEWDYFGAIRSLEVTYNQNTYHPHIHAIIGFNNLNLEGENLNEFSYDYKNLNKIRYFSDQEILIQKIWYLLNNEIRVNKKNIDSLDLGYSCVLDSLKKEDYLEIFKYMTKTVDKEGRVLTYENFKVLYYALLNVRQIQGYGVFWNITDEDLSEEVDQAYDYIIKKMENTPVENVPFNISDVLQNELNYYIISY
jgi:plasmid rolling circle replication initiator protein Rep